eukprot:CAMPEP_0119395006 /NCGR_PEP_ID=MMETSP1334-20130426/131696_1 /TAXON_ID=127549 /ORGANISM="Calcidiscus leptoporus, Strain RCC1130" /LENGTH=106 /DNA_ID=CAMNT_0007418411 /DNA_START=24 /DNA_END=340 /DNA_ORIENTATION=+
MADTDDVYLVLSAPAPLIRFVTDAIEKHSLTVRVERESDGVSRRAVLLISASAQVLERQAELEVREKRVREEVARSLLSEASWPFRPFTVAARHDFLNVDERAFFT